MNFVGVGIKASVAFFFVFLPRWYAGVGPALSRLKVKADSWNSWRAGVSARYWTSPLNPPATCLHYPVTSS
ncbi:hypothetical protein V8F20_011559 [Naviculisporaceae sp. PSN 640]